MPYIMKPRVASPKTKSAVQDKYWRNVLARARAADHRVRAGVTDEPVFSNAAKKEAMAWTRMALQHGDAEAVKWAVKFEQYVYEGNPYAAYHSMLNLQRHI